MRRNGRILWSATFEGPAPEETKIIMGAFAKNLSRISTDVFDVFTEIVELSNFSGPASTNFKLQTSNFEMSYRRFMISILDLVVLYLWIAFEHF